MSGPSIPVVEIRQPGGRPLRVLVQGWLDIGRDCDGLLLGDPGVSRRHARLETDNGQVWLRDMGSTNGTYLNGQAVTGPTPVSIGDQVLLGHTELVLVDGAGGNDEDASPPEDLHQATVAGVVLSDLRVTSLVGTTRDGADGETLTIVFSDIESSTEQAVAMGDGRWYDLLAIHDSIVRNNLLRHDGREVKSQGDGFMLTFRSARRAVNFAVDAQQAMARWSQDHPEESVRIRIGMHTGEAMVSPTGDLFGKHVIVAARIAALAAAGEILVSGLVVEITSNRNDLRFGPPREVELKGIEGTYTVHPLDWT